MSLRVSLLPLAFAVVCAAQVSPGVVEALDKQWSQAIIQRDTAALERILADDLVYAHASGVVDTKREYIDKIRSGRQVYKSLEQRKVSVRLYGQTAITHSWVRVTGVNAQGPFDDKIMMLHVWVSGGGAWRLAAHQTARVDQLP